VLEYRDAIYQLANNLDPDLDPLAHRTNPGSCTTSFRFEPEIADALRKLASNDDKPLIKPIGNVLAKLGAVLSSEFADIDCVENYIEPLKGFRLSKETLSFGLAPLKDSPKQNQTSSLNYSIITNSNVRHSSSWVAGLK
jgi:hypothetical protein